jgi:hypothetical protein
MSIADSRKQLIEWNNKFPLDRKWRLKNNITLFSKEHLSVNQIDIYLEWLEEQIFEEFFESEKVRKEKQELFDRGIYFTESTTEEDDKLFEKLKDVDFSQLNISIVD